MLAKVLGLVRDSMLAANFGTGLEADAFLSATKLPTTMFDMVVGGVISASFIPIFTGVNAKKDTKSAMEFANKFITLILIVLNIAIDYTLFLVLQYRWNEIINSAYLQLLFFVILRSIYAIQFNDILLYSTHFRYVLIMHKLVDCLWHTTHD